MCGNISPSVGYVEFCDPGLFREGDSLRNQISAMKFFVCQHCDTDGDNYGGWVEKNDWVYDEERGKYVWSPLCNKK